MFGLNFTTFPEVLIIAVAMASLLICIHNFKTIHDEPALGYIAPSLFFICLYIWILFWQPQDIDRRFWVRLGTFILFSDIIFWRVVAIIEHRRIKNNGKSG